jgi:DnaJ-class molecular chaperone
VLQLVCQLISAVFFGMYLGRIIERHRSNTKVGTPSASHNTGMVSASQICPDCDGVGLKRGFGAVLPTRCYCSHCRGTGKLHHT